MVFPVDRQPARVLARREGPLTRHAHGGRVDLSDRALVLEVHVELPVAGGHSKLGPRAEVDVTHPFSGHRVERGRGVRITVERENPLRRRVVENRVVVRGDHRVTSEVERLQVEHRHRAIRARGRKAVLRLVGERDSMRTVEPDDLAELFPGPGIHHDDSVLMRDEQAMTDRVEREVVPPA
ncbi:MAG: hypothetical protein DMD67_11535, partial [Gemmatimonadetes bacterium]